MTKLEGIEAFFAQYLAVRFDSSSILMTIIITIDHVSTD
ncbi:hypothetical protein VCJ_002081 [Vibrio metoecus]|nr:hypothetical protein VCJ_002081 [Vibrio metoecus]